MANLLSISLFLIKSQTQYLVVYSCMIITMAAFAAPCECTARNIHKWLPLATLPTPTRSFGNQIKWLN